MSTLRFSSDVTANSDFYARWEFLVMGNPMFLHNTLEQPVFLLRHNRMGIPFSAVGNVGTVGTVGRPR